MGRITFRIDQKFKDYFEEYCEMNDTTMTKVLNDCIVDIILANQEEDYLEDSKGNIIFKYK